MQLPFSRPRYHNLYSGVFFSRTNVAVVVVVAGAEYNGLEAGSWKLELKSESGQG